MNNDQPYIHKLTGGMKYEEPLKIDCSYAVISALGGAFSAPTFIADDTITCDTYATLDCESSATIQMHRGLTASTMSITVKAGATVTIGYVQAKTVSIEVEDSSTLVICGGLIGKLTGGIHTSSTVKFGGDLKQRAELKIDGLSTWVNQPGVCQISE